MVKITILALILFVDNVYLQKCGSMLIFLNLNSGFIPSTEGGIQVKRIHNHLIQSITIILFIISISLPQNILGASLSFPFIVLSNYSKTMNIGEECTLIAVASTGALPKFKSSNSRVASVDTYGRITAKSAGTAKITAKIKDAEGSCKVTVEKTQITLSLKSLSLENGSDYQLKAKSSNGAKITFKSNKSSVASVDETGLITAKKPGEAVITVKADQTKVTCKVTVRQPVVKLNQTRVSLYRRQTFKLEAKITSKTKPVFKSNKKSIATVDEKGVITAIKHGTAIISVKADGVSKTCTVTVKSPKIQLREDSISMKKGEQKQIYAEVSSGNTPKFSSNKSSVATVDEKGVVTAFKKGEAVITISEDGTKAYCRIKVIEEQ